MGEPHRHHILYDAAGQRLFVVNQAMNRVDVLSGAGDSVLSSIDAPGATSIDLSIDGSTLWVGTAMEQILAVDTKSLQVCGLFNRGVSFLDASQFVNLTSPAPNLAMAPAAQPAEGANAGGQALR
ncbi:MAG TPA: hypothetical protein VGH37_09080 [Candidatus Acidoferrum sp.]